MIMPTSISKRIDMIYLPVLLLLALLAVDSSAAQIQATGQQRGVQEHLNTNAQVSAVVEGPVEIRAGETAKFTVKLTPTPNFEGGHLAASLGPVGSPTIYSI